MSDRLFKPPLIHLTFLMRRSLQFLFALQHLAHKRRTGFQEVVSTILSNASATPEATVSDFVLQLNAGGPDEVCCCLMQCLGKG